MLPAPEAEEVVSADAGLSLGTRVRSVGITRRAVALIAVVGVLILSYASSLRIYMNQQRDMAVAQQQIADRQARVAELTDELQRWQDPAYVRTQARERLGWVVPGETGYVVLGPDGKPIDGSNSIDSERADKEEPTADAWWARIWGSVDAADHPAPKPKDQTSTPKPTAKPTR